MRKKGKSGYYFARFYDPNRSPKQKSVALKTTRKDIARRKLARLERQFEKGEFDPWHDPAKTQTLSVGGAIAAFLDAKKGQIRESTLHNYRAYLKAWQRDHVPAGIQLRDLRPRHLRPYIHDREKAQNTRRRRYGVLRSFLNWCKDAGHLSGRPLTSVRQPKKKKQPAFFSAEDIEKILRCIDAHAELRKGEPGGQPDDEWLKDMIRVGVCTGLRRGELLRLRWRDVDLAHGILHVRNRGDEKTKSGHERSIKLVGDGLETLERLHAERGEEGGRVFVNSEGKPIRPGWASERMRFFIDKAKLPNRKRLTFHSLRHTTGSWLAMQGVPMAVIRDILGHSSTRITEVYAHASSAAAARAMEETFGG